LDVGRARRSLVVDDEQQLWCDVEYHCWLGHECLVCVIAPIPASVATSFITTSSSQQRIFIQLFMPCRLEWVNLRLTWRTYATSAVAVAAAAAIAAASAAVSAASAIAAAALSPAVSQFYLWKVLS